MTYSKYPEYSSCSGKRRYETAVKACDAGRTQMYNNDFEIQLYVYHCDYCHKYHLTQTKTDIPA